MTKQFNEANSLKKAANDTQFFWDMVNKNRFYHNNPKKSSKHEEKVLFAKKVEGTTDRVEIDDSIPVERSGPQSESVGVLQSFAELEGRVPPYVSSNIALMKYEKPTPIQKHSIPLGLEGLDLMCCAQTVSFIPYFSIQCFNLNITGFWKDLCLSPSSGCQVGCSQS